MTTHSQTTQEASSGGVLRSLGPGLVTGASDDDPSGVATYAQAGAQFSYSLLWTAVVCLPLMLAVQEICDRTALTTGQSLGRLARRRFGRAGQVVVGVLLVALLVANALNIAADLMAAGQGMSLLHAGPATLWSVLTGVGVTVLLVRGSFDLVARVFKWLCLSLLTYVGVMFSVHVDWADVGRGLAGLQLHTSASYFQLVVAILGTTISPYLFFWQSAHRVAELRDVASDPRQLPTLKRLRHHQAQLRQAQARTDVAIGMGLSQLVMFAIIVATAATLSAHGKHNIDSAAQAAAALRPIAGHLAGALFALGFIGTGILAVPILAGSASVAISGLLERSWGFDRSVRKAPLFYSLVAVGTVGGTLLSASSFNPIHLLVLVAVVNGIAAAPFLVVAMLIAGDREIMGDFRNGRLASTLGWLTVALMGCAGIIGTYQALAG